MKTKLLLFAILCSFLVLSVKGNNEASKNYNITDFSKLEVSSAIDIVYTKGKPAMTAQGDADLLSHLQVKSEKGLLILKIEGVRNIQSSLKIQISSSDLSALTMSGATSFITEETINSNNFDLNVSGASKFTVGKIDNKKNTTLNLSGASKAEIKDISSSSIQIDGSGASKLTIDQIKTQNCPINLSGASKLNIDMLQVPQSKIDISGGSNLNAKINVDNLTISTSGGSSATITGTTKSLKKDISGGSRLNAKNLTINDLISDNNYNETQTAFRKFDFSGYHVVLEESPTFKIEVKNDVKAKCEKNDGIYKLSILDQTGRVPKDTVYIYTNDRINLLSIHNGSINTAKAIDTDSVKLVFTAARGHMDINARYMNVLAQAGSHIDIDGRFNETELDSGSASSLVVNGKANSAKTSVVGHGSSLNDNLNSN